MPWLKYTLATLVHTALVRPDHPAGPSGGLCGPLILLRPGQARLAVEGRTLRGPLVLLGVTFQDMDDLGSRAVRTGQ